MRYIITLIFIIFINYISFGQCGAMAGITLPTSGTCTSGCSGTAPFNGQTINSVGTYYCYTGSGTFSSMTITNGYLRVCGNLTITTLTFATGTMGGIIIESGGSLTITNNLTIVANNSIRVYGTLNLNGNTTISAYASGLQIETTGKVNSASSKTFLISGGNVLINKGQFFVNGTLQMAAGSSMCAEESYTEVSILNPTTWQPIIWGGASGKKAIFNVTTTFNNTSSSFTNSSNISLCNKGCTTGCGTIGNGNTWDDGGSATLSTSSCSNILALPIILSSFFVTNNKNGVNINWSTTQEINNDYFEIQFSYDGINYQEITKINGQGNKNTITNYYFFDDNNIVYPIYYRLKQVDFDGNYNISNVIVLSNNDDNSTIKIYPNPLEETIFHIKFNNIEGDCKVSLIDLSGKIINTYTILNVEPNNTYTIQDNIFQYIKGVYYIEIITKNYIYIQKIVIK